MRKTKDEAEKTRTQLLDAAYMVFLERGYDAATIGEIAERAQVTRGAVYWHFKNKEEIFIAVVELALDQQQDRKNEYFLSSHMSVQEKLTAILSLPLEMEESYRLVNTVPELAARIPEFDGILQLLQKRKKNLHDFFKDFLQKQLEQGSIRLRGDAETSALMLFVLFEGLYYYNTEATDIHVQHLNNFLSILMDFTETNA